MLHTFHFQYEEIPTADLAVADQYIVAKAVEALGGSHSPYSHYSVGAALRLQNGEIILGANQENVSYPCTTCAERTALNYAQTLFPSQPVEVVAIVARRQGVAQIEDNVSPCGLCRQAMLEVERRQGSPVRILLVGRMNTIIVDSVASLLPLAF